MPADVEWDVALLTVEFLRDNWNSHPRATGAAQPANIELLTEDEDGNPRKGVDYTEEYILVNETGSREQPYIDGPREAVDPSASCNFEASTPQGRARREEIWTELLALAEYARKRSEGTPGNWDTVDLNAATVDDEVFNWWSIEGEFQFSAEASTI
mgnify:CR=1 FL=1